MAPKGEGAKGVVPNGLCDTCVLPNGEGAAAVFPKGLGEGPAAPNGLGEAAALVPKGLGADEKGGPRDVALPEGCVSCENLHLSPNLQLPFSKKNLHLAFPLP